jgi:hypothetical protein
MFIITINIWDIFQEVESITDQVTLLSELLPHFGIVLSNVA